jgi:tRNA pseudouridine38-40 synthase
MRTLRLTLAYDGTNYAGWQRQTNGLSVQQVLEEAFAPLLPDGARTPAMHAAGRTDAGVHAIGQVASLRVDLDLPADAVRRALNVRLPADVRVLEVADMPPGFHARFDATGKAYRYRIATGPIVSPFDRWFVWHVPHRCDLEAMRRAGAMLVGRHDFASFQASGSAKIDTVRTIRALSIVRRGEEIVLDVEGDGFLRHMVRAIVGTLVEIGSGTQDPDWIGGVVAARDRRAAGPTAPAAGLTLVRVTY